MRSNSLNTSFGFNCRFFKVLFVSLYLLVGGAFTFNLYAHEQDAHGICDRHPAVQQRIIDTLISMISMNNEDEEVLRAMIVGLIKYTPALQVPRAIVSLIKQRSDFALSCAARSEANVRNGWDVPPQRRSVISDEMIFKETKDQAKYWLEQAANQGHVSAQFWLGVIIANEEEDEQANKYNFPLDKLGWEEN